MKINMRISEISVLASAVVFACVIAFTSCSSDDDKDVILTEAQIPSEIKTYVQTHFPTNSIVKAEKETDAGVVTYDIDLSGNFELEFNNVFEIIEINGTTQLPNSVILQAILDYVATNYPNNFITDWELEGNHQQVELDNGVELEFQMNGDFIRVDND